MENVLVVLSFSLLLEGVFCRKDSFPKFLNARLRPSVTASFLHYKNSNISDMRLIRERTGLPCQRLGPYSANSQ